MFPKTSLGFRAGSVWARKHSRKRSNIKTVARKRQNKTIKLLITSTKITSNPIFTRERKKCSA